MSIEHRVSSSRVTIGLFAALIVAFAALAVRCIYLQYISKEYYSVLSSKQQQTIATISPQRGAILDCRGRVLAASEEILTVFAEPRVMEDPKESASELGDVLGIGAHNICRMFTEGENPGFVKIKVGVDPNQAIAVRKIHGVGIQSDWERHYPMGPLATHIVGFTSGDNRGLEGVELAYNKDLAGTAGRNIFISDAFRRPIRLREHGADVSDGVGIILTIDATIQEFAREALLEQYKNYRAESAIAVVAEPKTGAILAMVSLPDYDPNNFNTTDANSLRNRVITDQFEPGSLIKPMVMGGAIEDGVVSLKEKIFCENGNYCGKGLAASANTKRFRLPDAAGDSG